jgi:pimeloyl-ACP methyl ester carboxylesterase
MIHIEFFESARRFVPPIPARAVVAVMGAMIAATLAATPAAAIAQARRIRPAVAGKLTPCRAAGVDEEVLCGRREVFENRAAGSGRSIALNVVVLPATSDSVAGDALTFLAGGGVVPATRYARFVATAFPELRRHRDIVLVDQRGTGGSGALTCERAAMDTEVGLRPDERYLRYVATCRESLGDRADVRFYTTTLAMHDLDDVRDWLGYQALNVYGASYGTSAAATYVRLYPERVRTVVMHGVVPLDVPMPVDLAQSAQTALERVFDLCSADSACRAAFPDLRADLTTILARFDSIALAAPPGSMQRRNPGQPFRDALNTALSTADGIRSVPKMVHDAARGSVAGGGPPLPGPEPAPLGVRLAILCSEGLSAIDTSTIDRQTSRTFLGSFPVRFQLRWCDQWPTAPLPPSFRAPLRSTAPALLLTGELDPITPPAYAARVAAWFENSVMLVLPYKSHSDTDPCVMRVIETFVLSGGRVGNAECLARTAPIVFTR